ncbi:hypothetical protein [Anaerocolumna sp.]|uniref:hypothetical protein n=1 Tax=Anaerocolumna sp. TaxID=2041569 RepID=UPI0028AC2564|nr:hypothetical protein [Anaerocolumna sp.]
MKKIVGSIFLLIASILYATDRIGYYLLNVAMSNLGVSTKTGYINDIVTIVLAIISAILGIYLLLKPEKKD